MVSIRAHFERFPATVKGAFVLRAADGDPHQVQIRGARVREVAGAGGGPIDLKPVTLDVAPSLDLFVPFEFSLTELGAGWYGLECDVAIDGSAATIRPGKNFSVAWPRASVRRGTLNVGRVAQVEGGPRVKVEQVDCAGDSIRVQYASSAAVDVRLMADGGRVPVIETEFDEAGGRGRVTAYPLLKTQALLTIEVRGAAPIDVKLR
jgi:hypothetical protein